MSPEPLPPQLGIYQIILDYWKSRAVCVFAKIGLADHIASGIDTVDGLATRTGTHAPSLYRLLRALTGAGFVTHDGNGHYGLTPVSETLRSDVAASTRAFAISELSEDHYKAWGDLMYSVETGNIAFDHVYGVPVFEHYAANPETNMLFAESMTNLSAFVTPSVLEVYDFTPFKLAVDVGGGQGALLSAILKSAPGLKGMVTDMPSVIESAGPYLKAQGVEDRCGSCPCDFFKSVPEGGDLYLTKWILHDWNDEQCETILRNIHTAMVPGGTFLSIDSVVPDSDENSPAKFMDLNMMVMVGGRERTASEFKALFERSGFELTRILPTRSGMSVIEGKRR